MVNLKSGTALLKQLKTVYANDKVTRNTLSLDEAIELQNALFSLQCQLDHILQSKPVYVNWGTNDSNLDILLGEKTASNLRELDKEIERVTKRIFKLYGMESE